MNTLIEPPTLQNGSILPQSKDSKQNRYEKKRYMLNNLKEEIKKKAEKSYMMHLEATQPLIR